MRARHLTLAVSLAILLGGPACFLQADAEISIDEKGVSAKSGLYTDEVAFADMKGVSLIDEFPKAKKTNGFDNGSILRGSFERDDGTAMRVYVDTAIPPFVEIDVGGSLLVFNDPDPTNTKEMFEKVETALTE